MRLTLKGMVMDSKQPETYWQQRYVLLENCFFEFMKAVCHDSIYLEEHYYQMTTAWNRAVDALDAAHAADPETAGNAL